MAHFGKIGKNALAWFLQDGIKSENIIISAYCDMDKEHIFCDTYVIATADTLFVLSGTDQLQKGQKGNIEGIIKETDNRSYPLSTIETVFVEELVSTSRLVAKKRDGEIIHLTAMSNFCKADAGMFSKYFARLKKGEIVTPNFELDPEDNPDEIRCPDCGMRYPDRNRKICPRCMEKGKLYSRFGHFLLKYKTQLVILFSSLFFLTATSIIVPYFSKGFFLDNVLSEGGSLYGEVLFAIGIIVATQVLSQIADMINGYASTKIAARVVFDLKKTIFSAINRLSLGFFTGRQTGGLMTQVNSDANTIYSFFCDGVPYLLINIVQVAVLSVILFCMNPLLAAMSLVTVPIYFLLLRRTYGHSKKLNAVKYSADRTMNSGLADVIGGIRVVKAFSKEELEISKFDTKSRRAAKDNKRLAVFNNWTYPSIAYVLYIGNIVALGVGGYMVMNGELSYGELITFTAYVNMIYAPINFFSNMINWSAACTNSLQRLFEIYDTEPEISEKPDAVTPAEMVGNLEFKSVDFGYSKHKKVLDNVSFTAPAGKILGIVGHTGAGKSTIANLIMRLYDADEGGIYIDGINVRDISLKYLYENIAIVSQETYLFIGSVLDNIKYACPNATYEEVICAAKSAGAHDFIVKLPDGYNTKIGSGYTELSGGERQRLSIARAILRNPKILILDEATAAMDTKTEMLIQNALSRLTEGKTTIMIAHRLSTLRDADKLIVIEQGEVVETGTHDELLNKKDGVYNKLYTLQAEALRNAGITD